MKRRSLLAVLVFAIATAAFAAPAKPLFVEGELIVRFDASMTPAAKARALESVGGKAVRDFSKLVPGLVQVRLGKGHAADAAIAALQHQPGVIYAERNGIHYAENTPNDPSFSSLWGLHNTGQTGGTADADIDAPEAWDVTTGSSDVVVGVIDTGIDYNHPDLQANMWTNPGETPGDGIDNDGNGYVDDVYGINSITGTGNPMDDNDHGSHCAGTIGGRGNNGVGVAGVNWNVRLMALKFLSASGSGSTADAIECINYAVAKKQSGVNIRVLSNSWGGGGFEQALLDAINAANNASILFTAAAGNSTSNNDVSPHYPSSYNAPNVVAVASTTSTDGISSFSSYGATSVDLGAPGSSILSTTPGNTYSTFSGTSMATPHVSGVAALLLAANGTLTVADLKSALLNGTDAIASLAGKCVTGGRLNAAKALTLIGPPQPDFNLSASPASRTINQGQGTTYAISTTAVGGFVGNVTFSTSSSPSLNATLGFSPNPVAAGAGSTLNVTTTTATVAGTYTITITGTSGAKVHTTQVTLVVYPEGTVTNSYDANPGTAIPDNNTTGITSTINVPDSLSIAAVKLDVDITHTYIGDLEVTLSSPQGTNVIVHNRAGGSADNIHQSYNLSNFNGQNSAGNWTLKVRDLAGIDIGTLDHWGLDITGVGSVVNTPPTAAISAPANGSAHAQGASVTFTGTGSDNQDGNVTASLVWTSSINGQIGTGGSFSTSALSAGTHTITATATDSQGSTGSASITISVVPMSVTSINPNTVAAGKFVNVTIVGTGFQSGATVSLSNTSGVKAPVVSNVVFVNSTQITARITAGKSQPRGTLNWDVNVTNPGGATAKLVNGFRTTK